MFVSEATAAPSMADDGSSSRWRLCRAGIINVYQYDNEVLHFGGGRPPPGRQRLGQVDRDEHAPAVAPWDPTLADAFRSHRRIVHEELIIDDLLTAMASC